MTNDHYRKGRNYELFIKKVFNCERGKKHGAERILLNTLFEKAQAKNAINKHISYNRQFFKVKLYIEKALLKTKKKKPYINSYKHFLPLLIKLRKATTPNDLSKIASKTLSKIIAIENKLKNSA
jgi:hypothetical protein